MNFTDPSYLLSGNARQQKVYRVISSLGIMERFVDNHPVVCGVIPIGIDLPGSEVNIIMQANDLPRLMKEIDAAYASMKKFEQGISRVDDKASLAASFEYEGTRIQLFVSETPVQDQDAYRHMVQEHRLLLAGGGELTERIVQRKKEGAGTEEAFAFILGLSGSADDALTRIESLSDSAVCDLVLQSLYQVHIRPILPADNEEIRGIIRNALVEYGVAGEGTAFADKALDRLSDDFDRPGSAYFVAVQNGNILGGSGIQPLQGGPQGICELQKMYLHPEARGKRIGHALLMHCIDFAREEGYTGCYIETFSELKEAVKMYKKSGFRFLDQRMGATGHFSCPVFMFRELDQP